MKWSTRINETFTKRRRSLSVLIAILVLISIIGIVSTSSFFETESELIAVAIADRPVVRTDEVISFSSEGSMGDIEGVLWNFSDGNTSDERNPSHSFEDAGWYNVTLVIQGNNGKQTIASLRIGIQHEDEETERTVGRWSNTNPSSKSGPAHSIKVGPNIADPNIAISINLDRPLGTFIFNIDITYWLPDDTREQREIHTETATLTGDSHLFQYTVGPSDLPDEVSGGYAILSTSAQIDLGTCQGAVFSLASQFPMDIETN